ncbi:hypothetical protein PYW08_008577 [Mythimna loreyi]|uniref:Uncharacterized protein n=1 Tax=Mythimna loreyi TaxID=667449 RepID=A0ACC2QCU5_9NEOP|nr:hypothetical protein PYW08_008577 [Mythimna loreyi]
MYGELSPLSYILNPFFELIQSVLLVSYPAFIAEATVHEVDQIKTTLTGQLLRCSDESLRWELQTALQYVSLRPFTYTLGRVVCLDAYLPFTTINGSLRWELQTALQYVSLRPFTYTLCRAVSLDAYLPFTTISLSNLQQQILDNLFELVQSVLMVSCPALFVEATAHEVDQIKATLTGQLLRCSDESLRWELQTALQYVSLRPFKYTLCRAVSLDVYLPFAAISLGITYVIVLLQLSHFSV